MKKRGKNMNNTKNRYGFSKKYLTAGLIGVIVLMGMLVTSVQGTTITDTDMANNAESTEPTYIKASNDDDDDFWPPHHRHRIGWMMITKGDSLNELEMYWEIVDEEYEERW